MSKPRINAKVAKLDIGKPYQWSATGIGVVALDNALEAGHLIIVEMGDENEYWVMRPTAADLQNMITTVTRFGKTVYSFPTVVEAETVSTESEPEMTTTTDQPAAQTAASRADEALATFVKTAGEDYNSTRDQIVDLLASSHHLARRLGLDWKSILADSTTIYKATKDATGATPTVVKPAKAASNLAAPWTLEVQLPSGVIANAQRSKPYTHAALICFAGEWSVFAWVSSKETASKRVGDAKRSGIAVQEHRIAEVRIVASPEPSFDTDRAIMAEQAAESEIDQLPERDMDGSHFAAEPTAEEEAAYHEYRDSGKEAKDIAELLADSAQTDQQPTVQWPRTEDLIGLPFEPTPADEIEREVIVDEPMHVKIKGGTAVHYSDDGEQSYCGIQRDDMRQVDEPVTCRSCEKVAQSRAAKA